MESEVKKGDTEKSHKARNIVIGAAVVIVLLGGALFVATRFLGSDGGQAALEGTSVDASTLPVTLPFEYVAGHIVVDAVLEDGADPVTLILDTGAPTVLSDEVADRFSVGVAGTKKSQTIDGTVVTNDIVTVPELRLGQATFADVGSIKGFLGPDNPLLCISPNGLLGANLMKEAVWQIDYGTNEVTIAPGVDGLDHIDDAIALDFTVQDPASPSPILSFPSGDGSLTFLVDTGSDGSLVINPDDLAAVGSELDPSAPAVTFVGSGAAGSFDARLIYSAVDVELGSQQLDGFPMATLTTLSPGMGNLGNDFLGNYVVTIDWEQEKIYLDPLTDDARPSAPPSAKIGWDGSRVTVGSLVEGSDIAQAGLAIGQTVSSIDGQDVSAATFDDFCELSVAEQPGGFEFALDSGQSYQIAPVEDFYDPLLEG